MVRTTFTGSRVFLKGISGTFLAKKAFISDLEVSMFSSIVFSQGNFSIGGSGFSFLGLFLGGVPFRLKDAALRGGSRDGGLTLGSLSDRCGLVRGVSGLCRSCGPLRRGVSGLSCSGGLV